MDELTKICPWCPEGHQEKPRSAFAKNSRSKDGLHRYCSACRNKRRKERRDNDPVYRQKNLDRRKAWAARNPEWILNYNRATKARTYELRAKRMQNPLKKARQQAAQARYDKKRAAKKALEHQEYRKDPNYLARRSQTSSAWRRQHPEKSRMYARTRRALRRHAPVVEQVDTDVLYARDKGICQLCHTRCRRQDATQDHVIPLSEGGEHSYRNCVLAHMKCNIRKSNLHNIPQQQRLFG